MLSSSLVVSHRAIASAILVALVVVVVVLVASSAAEAAAAAGGKKQKNKEEADYSPQDWADAVALNPTSADTWLSLAASLAAQRGPTTVSVADVEYASPSAAAAKSVELQPLNATLWAMLAFHLPPMMSTATPSSSSSGDTDASSVALLEEGKSYSRVDAIKKALEINPILDRAWTVLASTLRSRDEAAAAKTAAAGDSSNSAAAATATAVSPSTETILGETIDFKRAIEKALEAALATDSSAATTSSSGGGAFVELGRSLGPKDSTEITFRGEKLTLTRRNCFERAVMMGKGKDFFAWYLLAAEIAASSVSKEKEQQQQQGSSPEDQIKESIKAFSKGFDTFVDPESQTIYTVRDCLAKSIQIEPVFAGSWKLLADLTEPTPNNVAEKNVKLRIHGGEEKAFSKKDMYVKALNLNEMVGGGQTWVNLGALMFKDPAPSVKVNGKRYDALALLARGLAIEPRSIPIAWILLGQRMNSKQKIEVGSRTVTKQDALERGLALDPTIASGWAALAATMPPRQTHKFKRLKMEIGGQDCIKKALSLTQSVGQYFVSGAATLAPKETMEFAGRKWTALEMLSRGLELTPAPGHVEILGFLGQRLQAEGMKDFELPAGAPAGLAGQRLKPKELVVKAVEGRPEAGFFWYALGGMLQRDETVEIGGEKYDMFGCLLKTAKFSPNNAHAFLNLGIILGERGDKQIPIKIAGEATEKMYGKKDLIAHALGVNPNLDARAWQHLVDSMSDTETVTIRDKKITKAEIMAVMKQQ